MWNIKKAELAEIAKWWLPEAGETEGSEMLTKRQKISVREGE